MTIYKYPLELTEDLQTVTLVAGAEVRHVGFDGSGALCLWAEVHPHDAFETRRYAIVGTGHPIPTNAKHIGSAAHATPFAWFIWHVFEVRDV